MTADYTDLQLLHELEPVVETLVALPALSVVVPLTTSPDVSAMTATGLGQDTMPLTLMLLVVVLLLAAVRSAIF